MTGLILLWLFDIFFVRYNSYYNLVILLLLVMSHVYLLLNLLLSFLIYIKECDKYYCFLLNFIYRMEHKGDKVSEVNQHS